MDEPTRQRVSIIEGFAGMNIFSQLGTILRTRLFWKVLLEFMPLAVFLVVVASHGIYVASAVLGILTLISMVLVRVIFKKMALLALITGITGILAAGATVYMVDPMFVKMKPTIVSALFGSILAAGLAMGKPLLRPLIGEDLNITDAGWRAVTWRWMVYFFVIAIANEAVWRGAMVIWPGPVAHIASPMADEVWALYKVVVVMPFTLFFAAFMLPLLKRYRNEAAPVSQAGG
jgi:intracellular septation protein